MKKFFKRALIVFLIIITAVIIRGYFTQASVDQQEWCKEKLEIISFAYTGAYENQLTQEMIDELGGWIDTYFQSYRETFGQDWNSNIVIWQMFVLDGQGFDDISWQLANEAVKNYNNTYSRNFKIDNPNTDVGEYIADTFMMQKFLLVYTGNIKILELCKAWEELNGEVSLDASISDDLNKIVAAENITTEKSTTTTTEKSTTTTTEKSTTTTTETPNNNSDSTSTTIIKYVIPDHKTNIESIVLNLEGEILNLEVIFTSENPVLTVGTLVLGCLENETDRECVNNTKKVQQLFDSHHPEAEVGNGRISACNDYHGLNVEQTLISLGNSKYKYLCKKYEFYHKDFILSQIDIDIDQGSMIRYNLSEVVAYGYGWQSDELSCFNNSKGWTLYADGVPDGYTQSLGPPYGKNISTNDKSCVDFTGNILFNGNLKNDGSILYINN